MNQTAKFKHLLIRKIATAVLVTASVAAFATLGDDDRKRNITNKYNPKSISLRSDYNFRANNLLITRPARFIVLNTKVTSQKGNATYIMPLKKKVLLNNFRVGFTQ